MRKSVFYRCLTVLLVTIIFYVNFHLPVKAEDDEIYAEYMIEEGDFLSIVAMMFNTTVDDILAITAKKDNIFACTWDES